MSFWTLEILDASWVENTVGEVDFVIEALGLRGHERVLDLACGCGRHCLELAKRGYRVVGVDITPEYVEYARKHARERALSAEFVCADVRDVTFRDEFDVVMNMADGAIRYFDCEEANLRLFDVIGPARKVGGQHAMGVCSAEHAAKHFPKRPWAAGKHALSLADFTWNAETRRMIYRGHKLKFGKILEPFSTEFPKDSSGGTRLYTSNELREILGQRGLAITAAYATYDTSVSASEDQFMSAVYSCKVR